MLSLIERMNGVFLDGTPCSSFNDPTLLRQSIRDNLYRMYSSKRGIHDHLPLFGITDAAAYYRSALQESEVFRKELQENVNLYEPRLQNARVATVSFDSQHFRLRYRLSASVKNQRVQFEISFGPDGSCQIV